MELSQNVEISIRSAECYHGSLQEGGHHSYYASKQVCFPASICHAQNEKSPIFSIPFGKVMAAPCVCVLNYTGCVRLLARLLEIWMVSLCVTLTCD